MSAGTSPATPGCQRRLEVDPNSGSFADTIAAGMADARCMGGAV
jgi:hypothetical protein